MYVKTCFRYFATREPWFGYKTTSSDCPLCQNTACDPCRDTFQWVDGTSRGYHNWEQGQPDNGPSCALLSHITLWYDRVCDTTLKSICERGNDKICTNVVTVMKLLRYGLLQVLQRRLVLTDCESSVFAVCHRKSVFSAPSTILV